MPAHPHRKTDRMTAPAAIEAQGIADDAARYLASVRAEFSVRDVDLEPLRLVRDLADTLAEALETLAR